MDWSVYLSRFLIPPMVFWMLLKRIVKGEQWYEEFKERLRREKLELSNLKGDIMRMQANYDNGWRPNDPIKFNFILKKIKDQL